MIQRIQTLFLLLVVVLGTILCFEPVVAFTSPLEAGIQRLFELSAMGVIEQTEEYSFLTSNLPPVELNGTWGLLVASALIPMLALVIIFLFKHRVAQMRLCIFLAALCCGYYGVLGIYVWFGRHNLAHDWNLLFSSCYPMVCLVLTIMAGRRIFKDEMLVRSADRMR